MGKNLKKVIFSVLLLAAVIVVSPKVAKAAGKVWMAGFNDTALRFSGVRNRVRTEIEWVAIISKKSELRK